MALEIEGSNPSTHPTSLAPIAQRTEHRSSDLALGVPNSGFTPLSTLTSHLQKPDDAEFPILSFNTDEEGKASHTIDSAELTPGTYCHWAVDDATGVKSNEVSFNVSLEAPLAVTRRIAFASDRDGNCEIYMMNDDGSEQARLTNTAEDEGRPTWSPKGDKIAFTSNGTLFIMSADGGARVKLKTEGILLPEISKSHPAWSPDGKNIVFGTSLVFGAGLVIANADGSGAKNLTWGRDFYPAWSLDNEKIAFASKSGSSLNRNWWQIYIIDADGRNKTQLSCNDSNDKWPAWSP